MEQKIHQLSIRLLTAETIPAVRSAETLLRRRMMYSVLNMMVSKKSLLWGSIRLCCYFGITHFERGGWGREVFDSGSRLPLGLSLLPDVGFYLPSHRLAFLVRSVLVDEHATASWLDRFPHALWFRPRHPPSGFRRPPQGQTHRATLSGSWPALSEWYGSSCPRCRRYS